MASPVEGVELVWRHFIISSKTTTKSFYAPNLAEAFDQARRYFGNVDLKWRGVRW